MEMLKPEEWNALLLSLKVAIWCTGLSLPPGILVAWVLARLEFPGKTLIDGIVHLPLVLPPVVVGYLLLLVMGRRGVLGGWVYDLTGLSVAFSWQGAALAAAIMAFPLMVRAIRLSLEAVDSKLEEAARTLGANRTRIFLTITLPLCLPGIIVGTILAFARALGEFGATITFVSDIPGETRTLPLAVYANLQSPGGEEGAFRLVILSIVIAIVAMTLSEYLSRRYRRRLER